ncbi:MAG: hypothetical protein OWS74_00955 [Firmicutes bacterium]|nr:hypothetical protein [Bacillota bacterium]
MKILLLRSSENPTLLQDLIWARPDIEWMDAPLAALPGTGESISEREQLVHYIADVKKKMPPGDAVLYARSYGAFSREGHQTLQSLFGVPLFSAPQAIALFLKEHRMRRLFVLSPYGQRRHMQEIHWIMQQEEQEVTASACMGHDPSYEIRSLKAEDMVKALGSAASLKGSVDAVYLASTLVRYLRMRDTVEKAASAPIVSAAAALLWQLDEWMRRRRLGKEDAEEDVVEGA